jgi:hypothetical protein
MTSHSHNTRPSLPAFFLTLLERTATGTVLQKTGVCYAYEHTLRSLNEAINDSFASSSFHEMRVHRFAMPSFPCASYEVAALLTAMIHSV